MPTQLELVLIAVVAISCLFILNLNRLRGGKHRACLPPGPPALPLLGHALELPVLRSSPETMKQWADSYGIYGGQRFRIVSSLSHRPCDMFIGTGSTYHLAQHRASCFRPVGKTQRDIQRSTSFSHL